MTRVSRGVTWLRGFWLDLGFLTPAIVWLWQQVPVERRNRLRRASFHLSLTTGFLAFQLPIDSVSYTDLHIQ